LKKDSSIAVVATSAAEGGTAALAPPTDLLNDDNELLAPDVIDFPNFNDVTISKPIYFQDSD
jgi:hypothetical protein